MASPVHEPSGETGPPPAVLESLRGLIASLREELQQYGELLALLDRQHELAGMWSSEELLQSIAAVQDQVALIEAARAARDRFHGAIATSLDQSATVPFAVLIPLLPADYQPLVEALVLENNQLLLRVQQRAHQNQVLMNRSLARMQRFVNTLPTLRESDTTLERHPAVPAPISFAAVPQLEVVG
jgi:hypothetical protein